MVAEICCGLIFFGAGSEKWVQNVFGVKFFWGEEF